MKVIKVKLNSQEVILLLKKVNKYWKAFEVIIKNNNYKVHDIPESYSVFKYIIQQTELFKPQTFKSYFNLISAYDSSLSVKKI